MNLHTYGIPLAVGLRSARCHPLRAVMNANGDRDKPLWNTEFGLDAGSLTAAWGAPQGRPARRLFRPAPESDAGGLH